MVKKIERFEKARLEEVAATAKPDTILGWYRQLIANKFDGSRFRRSPGMFELRCSEFELRCSEIGRSIQGPRGSEIRILYDSFVAGDGFEPTTFGL